MAVSENLVPQRITRLTPLAAVLALIETRVGAVAPQKSELHAARDFVLADDVIGSPQPPWPVALRDGFAVEASTVADAGPYTPVALPPTARPMDVGEPLPAGTDAVLPLDAVVLRGHRAEAIAAVAASDGMLPAGGDVSPGTVLRRAGETVRTVDIAALRVAGITEVTLRVPRIHIVWGSAVRSPVIDAALALLSRMAGEAGATVMGQSTMLEPALGDEEAGGIIAVGGTGGGRRDTAVRTLARLGRVEAYGIAVSPGQTAAFGFAGPRPVLLVPGRLDAALALWLLIGRHLVAKLAGGRVADVSAVLPLKRKVTSTIGLTELIPVRCAAGMAEPLGSGYLSLTALAQSDGWIVIPSDSEGLPAGASVAVSPWP